MNNDEKMLYQKNGLSYSLVVWFVFLNTVHAIILLTTVDVDLTIGIIVMTTIVLAMVGFLAAVKLQTYSREWSYVAIILGVYQIARLFSVPSEIPGNTTMKLAVLLVVSAVVAILGGVISIQKSNRRAKYINEH